MKQILGIKKPRGKKERCEPTDNNRGSEVMSGSLVLIQVMGKRTLRVPVFVRVYRSCYEHYAVVYRDVKYSACSTFINLKNAMVMYNENCNTQLRVVPHNMEGSVIVFDTRDKSSVTAWRTAFEDSDHSITELLPPSLSPVIPKSPVMPTLEEEEE